MNEEVKQKTSDKIISKITEVVEHAISGGKEIGNSTKNGAIGTLVIYILFRLIVSAATIAIICSWLTLLSKYVPSLHFVNDNFSLIVGTLTYLRAIGVITTTKRKVLRKFKKGKTKLNNMDKEIIKAHKEIEKMKLTVGKG